MSVGRTMPIHLSVQANAVNFRHGAVLAVPGPDDGSFSHASCPFLRLPRSSRNVPDMELEVFVHGALCIAYSGRCLLSGYMNHRDSNQGALHKRLSLELQASTRRCRPPRGTFNSRSSATRRRPSPLPAAIPKMPNHMDRDFPAGRRDTAGRADARLRGRARNVHYELA